MAKRLIQRKYQRGRVISKPEDAAHYLPIKLNGLEQETFWTLFLDNSHRVLAFEQLFSGTINQASVYPREVVKNAIAHNAAAVIFCHNHPSGNAEPSLADEKITNRLKEALSLIDIKVLDHLIVGETVVSFAERGLL